MGEGTANIMGEGTTKIMGDGSDLFIACNESVRTVPLDSQSS